MTILYFTTTGNSLQVAKALGGPQARLLPIPQLVQSETWEVEDDVIGIVFPCYYIGVPRPVAAYLKKANIKCGYLFTAMTYGSQSMSGLREMYKLLSKRGLHVDYMAEVLMADNYLPMFEMEAEAAKVKDVQIQRQLDAIVQDMSRRRRHMPAKKSFSNFISGAFSLWFRLPMGKKQLNEFDEKFILDENCNGCGICRDVCPVGNIEMEGGPVYQHRCESCLGCIHHCPQNALHLKKEKSEARFINPHTSTGEIIAANCRFDQRFDPDKAVKKRLMTEEVRYE